MSLKDEDPEHPVSEADRLRSQGDHASLGRREAERLQGELRRARSAAESASAEAERLH